MRIKFQVLLYIFINNIEETKKPRTTSPPKKLEKSKPPVVVAVVDDKIVPQNHVGELENPGLVQSMDIKDNLLLCKYLIFF
jgi:hypothetical protein